MSYPDLVEDAGCYYLVETQKEKARVHQLDPRLLEGMWSQLEAGGSLTTENCIVEWNSAGALKDQVAIPPLPRLNTRDHQRPDYGALDLRSGFTVELWLQLDHLDSGQRLLDARADSGQGWALQTTERGAVEIILNDGRSESRWDCDPDMLQAGRLQQLAVIVDGGPKIISFYVDGVLLTVAHSGSLAGGVLARRCAMSIVPTRTQSLRPEVPAREIIGLPKRTRSGSKSFPLFASCASTIATCEHLR